MRAPVCVAYLVHTVEEWKRVSGWLELLSDRERAVQGCEPLHTWCTERKHVRRAETIKKKEQKRDIRQGKSQESGEDLRNVIYDRAVKKSEKGERKGI